MDKKSVLIVLADGFEEMEAIVPADLLRRAGINVLIASIEENMSLTGRNYIHILADVLLNTALKEDFDCVLLPGGPGHKSLRKDKRVIELITKQASAGRLVAAICAAPTVLLDAGLLEGKKYTAHFSCADELKDIDPGRCVVEDGNIITSRGAGTATEFGLAIIARLEGQDKANEVAESICFKQ